MNAIVRTLGAEFVKDADALVKRARTGLGANADQQKAREALVDLLISMIVTEVADSSSGSAFVSRLDNVAERLRSEGMARRWQPVA